MEDVYIPNYKIYGLTSLPLAFFAYIAGSFGSNINSQLSKIISDTGVSGSAMPVDIFINFAQDYAKSGNHGSIKDIFSVGREVQLSDLTNSTYSYKANNEFKDSAMVAEEKEFN